MANADAELVKLTTLTKFLTFALGKAIGQLRETSGQDSVDEFAHRFRQALKGATPEGPTTEDEIRDIIDSGLAIADEVFGPIRPDAS